MMTKFTKIFTFAMALAFVGLFTTNESFADSPRISLLEDFNNASCPPCVIPDAYLPQWTKDNHDKVIVITYHAWWPGSTDPMYTINPTVNQNRIRDYYGVQGVPSYAVNGKNIDITLNFNAEAENIKRIDDAVTAAEGMSPIDITFGYTIENDKYQVKVNVVSSEELSGNKKLRVAMIEGYIEDPSAGSILDKFYDTVREMYPNGPGTGLNLAANEAFELDFTVDMHADWDPTDLQLVAFVQDDDTKEVLQAARFDELKTVGPAIAIDNGPYRTSMNSKENSFTYKVTNNNDFAIDTEIIIDEAFNPNSWDVSLSETNVTLEANETKEVQLKIMADDKQGSAIINVTAKSSSSGEYLGISSSSQFYTVADHTENAIIIDHNPDVQYLVPAINSSSFLNANFAFVPFNTMAMENISLSGFNNVMFTESAGSSFALTLNDEANAKMGKLKEALEGGTNVLLTSSAMPLWYTKYNSNSNNNHTKDFFNLIGISSNDPSPGNSPSFSGAYTTNANGQITGINTLNIMSETHNITEGLNNFEINRYNQAAPVYILYPDVFINISKESTMPLFRVNHTDLTEEQNIVAVNGVVDGGGKFIYMGFGLEVITDGNLKTRLLDNALTWLSTPASVRDGYIENTFSMTVGPNPVVSESVLEYNIEGTNPRQVEIRIIDAQGKEITTLVNDIQHAGTHTVNINSNDFVSGAYRIVTNISGSVTSVPFVVNK